VAARRGPASGPAELADRIEQRGQRVDIDLRPGGAVDHLGRRRRAGQLEARVVGNLTLGVRGHAIQVHAQVRHERSARRKARYLSGERPVDH
jgi:hypothetical protein